MHTSENSSSSATGPETAAGRRLTAVEAAAIQILSAPITLAHVGRNDAVSTPPASPRRWPLLLNQTELCEYLGVSWRTLKGILTVSPIDMGANVTRYNRQQIDAWIETRPSKSKLKGQGEGTVDQAEVEARAHEAMTAALDRARAKGRSRQ